MRQGDKWGGKNGKFRFHLQPSYQKYICVLVLPSLSNRNICTLPCLFYFYSAAESSLRMLEDPQSHFYFKRRQIKLKKFKEKQNLMIK